MTRDEIVVLAKEAGFETELFNSIDEDEVVVNATIITDEIMKFANLVAEKEREACAVAAWAKGMELHHPINEPRAREIGSECANAIRARSSR